MKPVFAIICMLFLSAAVTPVELTATENEQEQKFYLYQWTDSQGGIHIADNLEKVPEQYRSRVRKLQSKKPDPDTGFQQNRDTYSTGNEAAENNGKAAWQERIRYWKGQLADAETRYQALDHEYKNLYNAWGSSALAPAHVRLRAGEIEEKMKSAEADISAAKNMLDTVIPEEARKAGAPPGWLRD